jgi:hypothetical protein
MASGSTRGWLPVDLDFDPEPAVVTNAVVRWMEFGSRPLSEPFFSHTLAKMHETIPPVAQIDTSLEAMLRMSDCLPPVRPSGFIFHVSHCGSTLLANVLKTAPSTVVASEAAPFVRLARWYPETDQSYLRRRWVSMRKLLFDSLCRLYAHYRNGDAERLVIKFSSLSLFGMKCLRESFPETPCVVLVRDPIDVLVSSLGEAGWLVEKKEPARVAELYGWTDPPRPIDEMSDEEYCARLLGRHLEAALNAVDDRCKIIDYEDLNRERMGEIAAFFGLELAQHQEDPERLFRTYSKDPAHAMPFRDDRARKQHSATPVVRAAAQQWAMPSYVELRGRGAL